MLERWFENVPDWVARFVGGFIAGFIVVAGVILIVAPLALALYRENANWLWAYVIIIPFIVGAYEAIDDSGW